VVHSQTLEIETRLEILHNRLPHDMPFKKRWQLLDRINRLRDEIHLGQGVSLWSMQDDFMFAATKNVEKYLQDLENEIEQFELSWLSYRVSESKEEELDTSDDMYFEDNEDSFWDDDGFL
jgi:hypothetical protein